MRPLVAAIKMLLFALVCLIGVPAQMILMCFTRGPAAYVLPCLWHKTVCAVFGIKVRITGAPHTGRQTIFVGNHLSYLDIPAIGSVLKASFVAKKDVAGWPVFGFLSKLQQTAFISRARADAAREKNALDAMLCEGKSLILFPEGTSTDGREVLPFKSSLFSIALKDENKSTDLLIQPFTIVMDSVDGKSPQTQEQRDLYAWHIAMDTPMPAHLWRFARSRGAVLRLVFHDPVPAREHEDRKTLAKHCRNTVSNGLSQHAA